MSIKRARDRQIDANPAMPALVRLAWDYSVSWDSFVQVSPYENPEIHRELEADLERLRTEIVRLVGCETDEAPRTGRGVWLVPPTTSAEQRAELARDGARVVDGWWLTSAVWTAGDGA